MSENRVNATLTAADQQAVMTAINTIREKLPFLIDLSPEDRRGLPKMGDKSRAFVSQALDMATQNSDFLPRSFDVEEMRQDVELVASLQTISAALTQLQEMVEDTYLAVGSEAYTAALAVYNYARSSGQGAALDNLLDAMGRRFARKTRPSPAPTA
jgi:hypothetical protein